jgi:tRNA(fMet)-specific endonuclease VapC
MILLDTDHVTVLRYEEDPRCAALSARRSRAVGERFATTVITLEEQMRGWLAKLGRARDVRAQIGAYGDLAKVVAFFGRWQIVGFDSRAADEFQRLRRQRVRIPTPDLKIASIALVHGALLLSANLRDYQKVPGLLVENWLV